MEYALCMRVLQFSKDSRVLIVVPLRSILKDFQNEQQTLFPELSAYDPVFLDMDSTTSDVERLSTVRNVFVLDSSESFSFWIRLNRFRFV